MVSSNRWVAWLSHAILHTAIAWCLQRAVIDLGGNAVDRSFCRFDGGLGRAEMLEQAAEVLKPGRYVLSARVDDAHGEPRVIVNGLDATDELRTETAGAAASAIAAHPPVRAALVDLQKGFRKAPGLVADGRDMGTVIFPDAPYKVFLTASAEERAQRRYKQLKEKGVSVNLAGLLHEIAARDERDAGRAVAPLKPAEDAVIVDSTGTPITEVIERVLSVLPEKLRQPRQA